MALLRLQNVSLAFGGPLLLNQVNLAIDKQERICLIGRNGAGKSTLLKVLMATVIADSGERTISRDVVVTQLAQEVPVDLQGRVYDIIASGLDHVGQVVADYHRVSEEVSDDPAWLKRLSELQQQLEAVNGWHFKNQIDTVISRLDLDAESEFARLSGGVKRRVLLAKALVQEPDILLLDEPTNHLDISAIGWLESFLLGFKGTLIFITHDRSFLQRLATRIIELDRGQISSWPGNYSNYLRRKAEQLEAEDAENKRFDKKLAQEEVWIRQGIKARRTRNEGRVRALKKLREARSQRRDVQATARLRLEAGERSGKKVIEAENLAYAFKDTEGTKKPIVKDLSILIQRGDKVGLIGPNGVGKTTLLRLLLGQIEPLSGKVKQGTNLQIAWFDQLRSQLDDSKSVRDNLDHGADKVMVNGKPRHVMSYLQDFLFSPERAHAPISRLSGGERNRLLLAKLFLKPANVLVMDEPTNDLDVETLELLEELLLNYAGTVLLVSHDRQFLDNVVSSCLVFEGHGVVTESIGGYEDWARQQAAQQKQKVRKPSQATQNKAQQIKVAKSSTTGNKPKKLSYKEKLELEAIPAEVEALEAKQDAMQKEMAVPAFYQQDAKTVAKHNNQLQALEARIDTLYSRWEALEEKQAELEG